MKGHNLVKGRIASGDQFISDMADDSYESTYSFNEETAAKMSASLVLEMMKD